MTVHLTHIGTATVLIEIDGLRLLTDPALDPPGKRYVFAPGMGSRKTATPVIPAGGLGVVDAVLLTHDQHGDNLDDGGRRFLPTAGVVITTVSGARRIGGKAIGLKPWQSTTLRTPGGLEVRATATPARHGPIGSRPFVGEVIGFLLEWSGQRYGALYISGDTVRFRGVDEVARRFRVGTALLHLGGVRFGLTGPIRYTFSAREAAAFARVAGVRSIIPIHYAGWEHFREGRAEAEQAFAQEGLGERMRWLPAGERTQLEV